jgi:hypothetical protein
MAEVLLATNQVTQAHEIMLRLDRLRADRHALELRPEAVRMLALIEAKLGDPNALPRLAKLIAQQTELGVSGLRLGLSYEARAQIAIWQRDAEAFEEYAGLTAHEYRYGAESALGARYDRLVNEARRQGLQTTATLEHFATNAQDSQMLYTNEVRSSVHRSLTQEQAPAARMQAVLQLICVSRQITDGKLYMRGPDGLQLTATLGNLPAISDLSELERFLERAQERANQLDEMTTGELASSSKLPRPIVRAGEIELDLLSLSTIVDNVQQFIGLIAVPSGRGHVDEPRERQLLHTVAAQLLALSSNDAPKR